MIILDTNVISEMIKARPSEAVLSWLTAHQSPGFYTTAVSQAELHVGIEVLPVGKRRLSLEIAMDRLFRVFDGRVLPFDASAARHFSQVIAKRRSIGRPIAQFDAMIASIALARDYSLATRNGRDFEHCGVGLVNPWDPVNGGILPRIIVAPEL